VAIRIGGFRSAASFASSSWPTAETTGATGSLTTNAATQLDTDGATYTNQDFTYTGGRFDILGDNVTFTNCRFRASEVLWNVVVGGSITDCTFDNGWSVSSSTGLTFLRCKVVNYSGDAIHVTSDQGVTCNNIIIRDCYTYNSTPAPGAHSDGMQVRGSTNLWLDHCYMDQGPTFSALKNAAVFFEDDNGGNTGFLVEDCYLRGGGEYTAYLNTGSGTVQNNTIIAANSGTFFDDGLGGDAVSDGITGSGNVDGSGNPVSLHPS
jgi:hypothetical protein